MTKETVKKKLIEGKTLDQLFDLSSGQECEIFKVKALNFDDPEMIVYIPDFSLNYLYGKTDDIGDILNCCYTTADFLNICKGSRLGAKTLFDLVDWQHPSSAFMEDEAAFCCQ